MMTIVDEVARLFQTRGHEAYLGEPVSQAEHAFQSAALAEQDQAPDSLVLAALLHDFGHVVLAEDDAAERGIDAHHQDAGADWLLGHFGPEVAEPARLHVAAKRYLCAVDPGYSAALSPASVQSLALQGGPMSGGEVAAFEALPHHADAVRLRRWDDRAKVPGLDVPGFEHYRARLEAASRRVAARAMAEYTATARG